MEQKGVDSLVHSSFKSFLNHSDTAPLQEIVSVAMKKRVTGQQLEGDGDGDRSWRVPLYLGSLLLNSLVIAVFTTLFKDTRYRYSFCVLLPIAGNFLTINIRMYRSFSAENLLSVNDNPKTSLSQDMTSFPAEILFLVSDESRLYINGIIRVDSMG